MINVVKKNVFSLLRSIHVRLTEMDSRIYSLKNTHWGKTCFILGSGPSLLLEDLEKIKGHFCFGVNKVYLAYPMVSWRPDYYVLADRRVAEQVRADVARVDCPRFVTKWAHPPVASISDWVVVRDIESSSDVPLFSKNLLVGAYGGGTVVYTAIQIAYYMGFDKVVLLGVDFSYKGLVGTGVTSSSGERLVKSDDSNYFLPGYTSPADVQAAPRYEEQRRAFKLASDVFEASGRRLVNASRKTALDTVPRGNLEDFL